MRDRQACSCLPVIMGEGTGARKTGCSFPGDASTVCADRIGWESIRAGEVQGG